MSNPSPMANIKLLLIEQMICLVRHKWIALAACWVVCLVGWAGVMMMPRHYESDARAFVDVNGLLTPLLKGLIVDGNTTTSDYLRQTLLSRPNLEQVLHLAQLDTGKNRVEKDILIAQLVNDVEVRAQGKNLFTISYTSTRPSTAKDVVESLLTIFAEKAANTNRVEMEKAHKFLDDQISSYEQQLRAAEQRRADFRTKYADALADPISAQPKLQTLQAEMNQARLVYNQLVLNRDTLQAQLKQVPQYREARAAVSPATVGTDGRVISGPNAARLGQAKAVLAQLRLKFTDQHPDVIAAMKEVTELEKTAAAEAQTAAATAPGTPQAVAVAEREANPTYDQIKLKLVDSETVIPAAQQHLAQTTADFEKMKRMSADIPDIDAKAGDLDRDYGILKKNFDELVTRRESANLSQAADDQADRTQFRIVDPPQIPTTPSSPKYPLMFSLVLILGIGAGVALPIAFDLIRNTFSSVARLRGLGLPVIGAVTFVRRSGSTRRIIVHAAGALVAVTALLAVYGTLIVLSTRIGGVFL